METPEGAVQRRRHDQPGRHPDGVAVEVDVDPAGVQPRHGDRRRDGEGQQAHQCAGERVGDELGDHDVAAAGRGEEGGGDRLVPVLTGHPEHAEQDGDEGDDGGRAADDLDQAVGSERVVALFAGEAEDGDRDEAGDDRGGADAGDERAGGALLEQFGADEAVHDMAPSVVVSEKKTSSRFDSSRRIS